MTTSPVKCVLLPIPRTDTAHYYNQLITIDNIKNQQLNAINTTEKEIKKNDESYIGKIFQDSKEWKFSLYYLETLIEAALSQETLQKIQNLKQEKVNVPFEMRFIRETRNLKTSTEQQDMVTSFVSKICKEGKYSYPSSEWKKDTSNYQTNNKTTCSSTDTDWRATSNYYQSPTSYWTNNKNSSSSTDTDWRATSNYYQSPTSYWTNNKNSSSSTDTDWRPTNNYC